MRNIKQALLLSTLLAPAFAPVAAHAQDRETQGQDAIVVTANRVAQTADQVGQSITIITGQDLARAQTMAITDALRGVPGVTVSRTGGMGAVASVNIRGADNDQSVVLIDGVKLNDPAAPGGGFNFGTLMADNIDRIEVVRGSQSVLWGSQAIGGVVNMITREPTDALSVTARGEYGWRDTVNSVANRAGRRGPVSASMVGGYTRSDGYSAYNEARGATERDGNRHYGANAKMRIDLSDALSVDLRGFYANSHADVDGFAPPTYSFGDTLERADTRELVGYAGVNLALFDGRLRNRAAYAETSVKRANLDLSGANPFETFAATGGNRRFEYQGTVALADGYTLIFGAETEDSRYATSSYGGPVARAKAQMDSFYGQ
ncbi:MAG: TonB-dependent receptor, partial [Sphingopyxis sp.]